MSKHLYDLSRRMDDGKWVCVGKAYENPSSGKVTMFIDPAKMKKALKGHSENVVFTMFPKEEPAQKASPVARPSQVPPLASVKQRSASIPSDTHQAPPYYTQPPTPKPSDNWPPEFDDDIPF